MRHSKFVIIYLLTCLVLASAALGADLSREVVVTYAFVPKSRLADAVKGKAEAFNRGEVA